MILSHAAVIFIGYFAFFLAVLTGFLFLIQERRLKRKDPTILSSRWVSLETLDRANLICLTVGFALFSIGTVEGFFLARTRWGSYFTADPKELWTLLTWGAYAWMLGLRLTRGFRGRRMIWMSLMSFLLVLFTFVGVNAWGGSRHVFF